MECISINAEPLDGCFFDQADTHFIAVVGFENSNYTLSVTSGAQSNVVDVELVTLQLDTPVNGSLRRGIQDLYRATSGNIASVSSISGDADLLVFSSDEISTDNLLCRSSLSGSSIDSCQFSDPDGEVYISVVGSSDATYSVEVSTFQAPIQPDPPTSTGPTTVVSLDDNVVVTPQGITDSGSGGSSGGGSWSLINLLALLVLSAVLKLKLRTRRFTL